MATKQHPQFIKVGGHLYQLETAAGDAAGREAPTEEKVKQDQREMEKNLSGKGSEKVDSGKEKKETEKSKSLPAASDKDNAANIPDKMTSPSKDFYDGKESKRDLKSFQLKGDSEKQYEENDPQKLPAKIKVKGEVYELVQEEAPQDDLPDMIRVKGEVYERVVAPPFLRVNGRTFVKLGQAEAMEVLAKKGKAWDKKPKGWTKKSMKEYLESLTGGAKHKVTKCIKKIEGSDSDIDDPGAFCSSLVDKIEGKGWRSEPRKKSKK
jgi:hypothetical protein